MWTLQLRYIYSKHISNRTINLKFKIKEINEKKNAVLVYVLINDLQFFLKTTYGYICVIKYNYKEESIKEIEFREIKSSPNLCNKNYKIIDLTNQESNKSNKIRELDDKNAATVYVRSPQSTGVGLAVYNRLLRAAACQVIKAWVL